MSRKATPERPSAKSSNLPAVVPEQIDQSILIIRGHKVLLDSQLANFYGVPTGTLMQAVRRNLKRFPLDFMFQLTTEEWENLRSQIVISSLGAHGGRRYLPYAFTEQGVAMLSGVLRSQRAIDVNIQIMRAFVRLRQLLAIHKDLADRLVELEQKMQTRDEAVDHQFQQVFELLDQLFNPPDPPRRQIGFHSEGEPTPSDMAGKAQPGMMSGF